MSRLARKPLIIPEKVKVNLKDSIVEVEGPLGKLTQKISAGINVLIEDNKLTVKRQGDEKIYRMQQGLMWSLINNMLIGVIKGFSKRLEIQGVGFNAQLSGDKLVFQIGFSHPYEFKIPSGIKAVVDQKGMFIDISGIDKQFVGEISSSIRRIKPPEHYKGTGIRYAGERVIKKAGKSAVGVGGKPGAAGGTGGK